MNDIVNAMSQLPFVAGFVAGGVVCGFLGLAIGWAKGHHAGYDEAVSDVVRARKATRIHNW